MKTLTIIYSLFISSLYAQNITVKLDTVLFTDYNLSTMEFINNLHFDTYEDKLYYVYYDIKTGADSLLIQVFDLRDYSYDTFSLLVPNLNNEISAYKNWNNSSIKDFQIIAKNTFLISLVKNSLVLTKDREMFNFSKDTKSYRYCTVLNSEVLLIDENQTNKSKNDLISFWNAKNPNQNIDYPFMHTEAISIEPNQYWDNLNNRLLVVDINGNITLFDEHLSVLDVYNSNEKPAINSQKMQKIRKEKKHFVEVMNELGNHLWSSNTQFTRRIHFINDNTFFVVKKCKTPQNSHKIEYYKIKDNVILFNESQLEKNNNLISSAFSKNNFPLLLGEAMTVLSTNNKIIKINKHGGHIYPIGLTPAEYHQQLNDARINEKMFTEIQIFNVIEN